MSTLPEWAKQYGRDLIEFGMIKIKMPKEAPPKPAPNAKK
jgi:hypothetical protein